MLGQRHGLTETERAGVLRSLIEGGDLSGFGLVNAVTHFSQQVADYDRATELEALGGRLVESPGERLEVAGRRGVARANDGTAVITTLSRTFSRGANRVTLRRVTTRAATSAILSIPNSGAAARPRPDPRHSQGVRSRHAQCCSTTQGRDHEALAEGGTPAACRDEEGLGAVPAPYRRAEAADQQPRTTGIGSADTNRSSADPRHRRRRK